MVLASSSKPPRLTGRALRAAVAAAESPMVGRGFKQMMFKQLGIAELMKIDLSGREETAPLTIPSPHPTPNPVEET